MANSEKIYIDKSKLESAREIYRKAIKDLSDDCSEIMKAMGDLKDGWDDSSKKKFFENHYPDAQKYMLQTIELLSMILDNLDFIDEAFTTSQKGTSISNDLNNLAMVYQEFKL